MAPVRHILAQRRVAMLICMAALLLKLLIPSGYMIGREHGQVAITLCSGTIAPPVAMATSDAMAEAMAAMPGMHGDPSGHGKAKDHGKAEMPCAFAGLAAATLGAIDPVVLVGLFAFIRSVGLRAANAPAPARRRHVWPPLRGPPARL